MLGTNDEGGRRAALESNASLARELRPQGRFPAPIYFAAAYRCATTSQATTSHHAERYAGRLFWYLR